jgi:hypothetical protein
MKPQERNAVDDFRQTMGITLGLCIAVSWPQSLIFTPEGKRGWRAIVGLPGLWGIGLLIVWAGLTQSEPMLYIVIPLTLIAVARHKLKSPRDGSIHSRNLGPSAFSRFCGGDVVKGRLLEGLFAMAGGALLLGEDPIGGYLIASGVGTVVTATYLRAKQHAVDTDLMDAKVEQVARASRMRNQDEGG